MLTAVESHIEGNNDMYNALKLSMISLVTGAFFCLFIMGVYAQSNIGERVGILESRSTTLEIENHDLRNQLTAIQKDVTEMNGKIFLMYGFGGGIGAIIGILQVFQTLSAMKRSGP